MLCLWSMDINVSVYAFRTAYSAPRITLSSQDSSISMAASFCIIQIKGLNQCTAFAVTKSSFQYTSPRLK